MEEAARAGTSRAGAGDSSQSILASHPRPQIILSRLSPNMLAPDAENPEPEPDANQQPQHSETQTHTQAEFRPLALALADEDSASASASVISFDSRSSAGTALYDAEDSRSSFSSARRDARTCTHTHTHTHSREGQPAGAASEAPSPKARRLSADDIDGETCPICLDSWGNSGEHRLVALKCGHLFGAKCVERWLRAQPARERACPTCKTRSTLRDVRQIYARRLVAADTSHIVTLQRQIDILQAEKNRVELDLQKSRIAHRACMQQLEVLRNTLKKSQSQSQSQAAAERAAAARRAWRFALEKNLEVHKDGGCRVLTYNCRTCELYVSQKNTNCLFPGYGIRKVSCVDYKLGPFVYLHPKPIRDITYSQPRDLLLSVGLDSAARVVERGMPSATVQSEAPLWSCCWDYLRSNEFYVGGVGGAILQYDLRNSSTYLHRLQVPGDLSPVVSLCSTEYGLLSCQLNSCWLWVANQRQWEPRAMPVEGPFMSLCYDNESNRALISCRPKLSSERSKLALCKLKASAASVPRRDSIVDTNINSNHPNWLLDVVVDTEQTFSGSTRSTLMSRAAWVKAPGAAWVAAHSESDATLHLHGLDGARSLALPAAEPALDVCAAQVPGGGAGGGAGGGDTLLAALSGSRLRVYKAVPTHS